MRASPVVVCLLFCFAAPVFAEESGITLDGASAEALEKTKAVLTDPAKLTEAVSDPSSPAAAADRNLKALGLSPEAQDQAYRLSAEILEKWVHESGGNVDAMKARVKDAGRDPAGFAKELSPAQLEQIRKMSREIPAGHSTPN